VHREQRAPDDLRREGKIRGDRGQQFPTSSGGRLSHHGQSRWRAAAVQLLEHEIEADVLPYA
jgi:hypothetical protein